MSIRTSLLSFLFALNVVGLCAGENQLVNGNFEKPNAKNDAPEGWSVEGADKVLYISESSGRWLRFNGGGRASQTINVKPEWKWLKISALFKTSNIQPGHDPWNAASIMYHFEGKKIAKPDYTLSLSVTVDTEWTVFETAAQVPDGAETLVVEPGMYGSAGTLDIDDIKVETLDGGDAEAKKIKDKLAFLQNATSLHNGKFEYGTFERLGPNNKPIGWTGSDKFKLVQEGNNHFMQATQDQPGWANLSTYFLMNPDWDELKIKVRMKAANLKKGSKNWESIRLSLDYIKDDGTKFNEQYPASPQLEADGDWKDMEVTHKIPRGAWALRIDLGMHNCTGTGSWDDIQLTPMKGGKPASTDTVAVNPGTGGTPALGGQAAVAASKAPKRTLDIGGLIFGPDVAAKLQRALGKAKSKPKENTLTLIGGGTPAKVSIKAGDKWTLLVPDKDLTVPTLTPLGLLSGLPEYLAKEKPEVLGIVPGAAPPTNKDNPQSESADWEDVIRLCLRQGTIPIVLVPGATGNEDKDAVRTRLMAIGLSEQVPVLEFKNAEAIAGQVKSLVPLLEQYVFCRVQVGGNPAETGKTKEE